MEVNYVAGMVSCGVLCILILSPCWEWVTSGICWVQLLFSVNERTTNVYGHTLSFRGSVRLSNVRFSCSENITFVLFWILHTYVFSVFTLVWILLTRLMTWSPNTTPFQAQKGPHCMLQHSSYFSDEKAANTQRAQKDALNIWPVKQLWFMFTVYRTASVFSSFFWCEFVKDTFALVVSFC